MKKLLTIAIVAFFAICIAGCDSVPATDNPDEQAAYALAGRILPSKAGSFIFEVAPKPEEFTHDDFFRIEQRGNKIAIQGNNANSMAVGLNHYLKYYCNVEVGWFVWDTFKMPSRLPKVEEPVCVEARVDKRFFLNYCTYGYTMPWWHWDEWEHFIDWMALNGVNLPLAITGQESIWYEIWTELGLSDEEVRNYFTGPAHLPWHRMQNIDRWGGPLPISWLEGQKELQKHIVARERELNMKPVLPAFAGHVPRELTRLYPDANIKQLEAWAGYSDEYACSFLDPETELYPEIQKKFVEKETEIYGTDHVYGIDIFNELMPPSWEPEYLGRVSRQVYESLEKADPQATWLQMGWLFYNERKYWLNDRVEAYLTSFPVEKQIMLDYYCERQEVWQRTEKFFGVPYIWCYLGNFGGNTMLCGDLNDINGKIENTFVNGGDNFSGIGSTLEGFDCNPFVYQYIFEKAWNLPQHQDVALWTEKLADQRFGKVDENARAAWKMLIDSIYTLPSRPGQCPMINIRPTFGKFRTYYANPRISYENKSLAEALGLMIKADGSSHSYMFDLANLTRQLLSNYFLTVFRDYEQAYNDRDREAMAKKQAELVEILDDVDRVVGSQTYFLVGKWISDARGWGATPEEADYFESNARNLLTTWSDKDMLLNDYASRTWQGLTSTFYKVRWTMFFDAVNAALEAGEEFDDAHYDVYKDEVTTYEKQWWDERLGEFPSAPVGDSKKMASELYDKYKDRI